MAKRNFTACAAALVIGIMPMSGVRAQDPVIGVDGCAILAILVYTEVTQARLAGGSYGLPASPGPDEITICSQTTRSVTRAFTSSLQQMNIYVSWGYPPRDTGDYCLSHYLSQCYPDRDRNMPSPGTTETAFVLHSWRAVHDAIRRTMPAVSGSDVARFSQIELRRDIRRSLATFHVLPGQAEHFPSRK